MSLGFLSSPRFKAEQRFCWSTGMGGWCDPAAVGNMRCWLASAGRRGERLEKAGFGAFRLLPALDGQGASVSARGGGFFRRRPIKLPRRPASGILWVGYSGWRYCSR